MISKILSNVRYFLDKQKWIMLGGVAAILAVIGLSENLTLPMVQAANDVTPVPGVITYQGVLTDANGNPVNGNVDMIFRIYNVDTGGTPLWIEEHTGENAVPVQNGLFQVYLGSLQPFPPDLWEGEPLYMGIEVGGDSEMSPREVIGRVPGAIEALTIPDAIVTTSKLNIENDLTLQGHNLRGVGGIELPFQLLSERPWEFTSQRSGALTMTGLRSTVNEKSFAFWNPDDTIILSIRAINGSGFLDMHSHPIKNVGAVIEANLQTPEEIDSERIERFERGDVLCWDASAKRLEKCAQEGSVLVMAVADERGKPIVLGAEPIKVVGQVRPGDLLIASDVPGYAVA